MNENGVYRMMRYLKFLYHITNQLWFILNKKQRKSSMLIFCMIIVGSILETLGVSVILPFIESISSPDSLRTKWYSKPFIAIWPDMKNEEIVLAIGIVLVIIFCVKNLYLYFFQIIQTKFKFKTQKYLGVSLLNGFMGSSYEDYVNTNTAEVMKKVETDVFGAFNVMENLFHFFSELFTAVLISVFILYTDFVMALCIIVIAGICFLLILVGFKKKTRSLGEIRMETGTKRAGYAYQAIMGFKEIKVTRSSDFFLSSYEEYYSKQNEAEVKNSYIVNIPERLIESVCVGALIGVISVKILSGSDMSSFIPKLSAFALAAFRLLPSVSRMTRFMNGIFFNQVCLENVYNNLKTEELVQYHRSEQGKEQNFDLHFDRLLIDNVTWKYRAADRKICDHLTLEIKNGEAVGLMGTSGSGKTTLADIILGLLKPSEGSVYLDELDIYEHPDIWSKVVGYVPQNVFLADDTLRNNIAFGQFDIDDSRIWNVLEQAQLKEFVENLPEGLDTQVGERGIKFSGGQRQRVAIARALYTNPEIIVLDEATSALDNETEKAVMEAIETLQGTKTLIIVAHRLATIQKCDKVYEIKDGKAILKDKSELFTVR